MRIHNKQDVMRLVEEEDVEFIRLQFTDILGNLKNIAITSSQLVRAMDNKCMFDGSAIRGFVGVEESDLYLYPDLSTLAIFPWRPQQGKVARLLCDVYRPGGAPFEGDPRYVLKRAVQKAADLGYTFEVGPECEFFLFHTDENALPTTITHEKAGYFDVGPVDLGENARRDMVLTLEEMGLVVEASHHEAAPAQHEIDLGYEEALKAADDLMTFKLAVRTIAKGHGLHATFMPKPVAGVSGSGFHINMSLHRQGVNIFHEETDALGLSREAYYFMGGLMKHIKGMAAITNPLVNSYKRLVPGYEAPTYIAWSAANRSPLIRIPSFVGNNARVELRSPDPSANPYLTLAVCLMAGLDGVVNRIEPPKCVNGNIFAMSDEERISLCIERMPATLLEALEELEKDDYIKDVLGNHVAEKYIAAKKEEWYRYTAQVTDWELKAYL